MFTRKTITLIIITAFTALTGCGSSQPEQSTTKEQNPSQPTPPPNADASSLDIKKVSEALGHFIGRNLSAPGMQFDMESVIKGIRNGAAGNPAPMSDQEYEQAMTQLQHQALNTMAEKNLQEANAFMQQNATAKGVLELIPGKLQYMILEEGSGPAVAEHGTPQINYTGKYSDGTVFGSSEAASGPITISIDQTIPGFSKGIAGMKEGEKRRLFVHPEVGYGTSGQLQPNALLIFDVEVVKAISPEKGMFDADKDDLDDESDDSDDQEFGEQEGSQQL